MMLVLLAALAQAPSLEVRAGGAWAAWPSYGPGDSATGALVLEYALAWRDTSRWLRVGTFDLRAGGSLRNSIAVLDLDPSQVRFSLGRTAPSARRTAAEWLAGDTTLLLAANTGLFRENGTSQGLVQIDGRRFSQLTGWLDAVVALENGTLRLTDIEGARGFTPDASAFQTLPWLVRDGRVTLGATSGLRLSRTHRDRRITLCLTGGGTVRLMLSNFEVFGATAGRIPIGLTIPEQAALAAGAGCRDAVALDGGISAQIAYRLEGRTTKMPGWRRVPLMLLVRRR